jgi:hypothetical protein
LISMAAWKVEATLGNYLGLWPDLQAAKSSIS